MKEWTAVGGSWQIANGVIYNRHSHIRGAKLLTGSYSWENYTMKADISFATDRGDMGTIIRSNDEEAGIDSYNGYYVGLRMDDGNLIIGRSNYGWIEARPIPMPGGVHPSVWYRLRVTAYNCNIAASVQNLTTLQTAWIAFEERSCVKAGRIGLRSIDDGGMWRNISIAPANKSDYLELRQHASSVEQPVVLNGPPWWTPWHIAMLFACALVIALLTQLVYFRIRQWKTFTIMNERERLAHGIHDTMAQSFAGIGYQIQGIRSSLLRVEQLDPLYIADQLSIAYQLIRRCHIEASDTIAMLGSYPPTTQQTILEALAETAHKIAGNTIKTITEIRGNAVSLDFRISEAFLKIGEEAIANAVSHSNLSTLTITLSYDESNVELEVKNDGKGFNYTPEKSGFGILGMQKRARDVEGIFCISSAREGGTYVRVRARLQRNNLRERIVKKLKEGFLKAPADFNKHRKT
jgi:signal transduction histidine kinase